MAKGFLYLMGLSRAKQRAMEIVSAAPRPLWERVDGLALLEGDDQRCWAAQA
jgi:hypothetical protein